MQAVLIIALFSILMGIVSSYLVLSNESTSQLRQDLAEENLRYFRSLEKVINSELTPQQLEAAPANATMEQLLNQPALAQLSPGRWGDPLKDSWGNSYQTTATPIRQNVALTSEAVAPVTGIVLLSAGPDRVFQTTLNSPTTLSALQGILPATGSDDLVVAFTNEDAQRNVLAMMKTRLERIASAMMRKYQSELLVYRATREAAYRQQLANDPNAAPPDWATLLATDQDAPSFVDIDDDEKRMDLGVFEEFAYLERILPGLGRLQVTYESPDLRQEVTLKLENYSASPSPWPVVRLKITLKGGFN